MSDHKELIDNIESVRNGTDALENGQIANMSRLDFLMLLWEARIVGQDYVEANT